MNGTNLGIALGIVGAYKHLAWIANHRAANDLVTEDGACLATRSARRLASWMGY